MPVAHSVILIPDTGPDAGMGHVSRCIALGEAFLHYGWQVGIVAADPLSRQRVRRRGLSTLRSIAGRWGVAVVDTYGPLSIFSHARRAADTVVAIDDIRRYRPWRANLMIRPAIGAASRAGVVGGGEYVLLPHEFWRTSVRRRRRTVRRVLVSLGSHPPPGSLARVRRVVAAALPLAEVDICAGVRGGVMVDDMVRRLAAADIAIVSGGQTLHEAVAMRLPVLVITTASNQRRQIAGAVRAGVAMRAGSLESVTFDARLSSTLRLVSASIAVRRRLSRAAGLAVDGRGALRVARVIGDMK